MNILIGKEMFSGLHGEWVSTSSEVSNHWVGKDCVHFEENGYVTYDFEYDGKKCRTVFRAVQDGSEYRLHPLTPAGEAREDFLQISIRIVHKDEIEVTRVGMSTVYRKKSEPIKTTTANDLHAS